ncbi:MAG TPA: glycoside hydrolase family 3 N-terminal domain-containing protein [Vicinamibacteria bacterium]|nr:glycoside hydrolase family 3 N-terminal domain-containing protein [Vicinamibacteria bacterium]
MTKPLIFGLLALLAACAGRQSGVPSEAKPDSWVETTLRDLTLEQKVGQLIFPRAGGVFVNEDDPRMIELLQAARDGRIGGVVLFAGDPYETSAIVNRLQEASTLPLLIASDYEYGAGMRVNGATRFPRAMVLGAGGTERDIEFQAEVTAREARALGVHLLLNPVLDVNTNADNGVIGTRSFGEIPERAGRLGAAFIRRAQSLGVLATAKHFPGHGATALDSHFDLPVLRKPRKQLESVELVPFRHAIEADVAAVMPAHIAVPALDGRDDRPATLSPDILGGLLRDQLGFDGLVVSDALDMGGARKTAWDGQVAVDAVKAGIDALLVPPDPLVTYRALVRAIRSGELTEPRIEASVRRILAAKQRVDLNRRRTVNLADLSRRVASPEVQQRIEDMAERAVTVVHNRGRVLPLDGRASGRIFLIEIVDPVHRDEEPDLLARELERRASNVRRARVDAKEVSGTPGWLAAEPDERVLLVLGRMEADSRVVPEALKSSLSGESVIVASLDNPYWLAQFSDAAALVATYDDAAASKRALARAIFGEIDLTGKLPVTLSDEYPVGTGTVIPNRRMSLERVDKPKDAGFSDEGLRKVENVVRRAIESGATPGAAYLVARRGRIVLEGALGRATYEKDAPAVSSDTLYDLASLTKVVVTTTLSMIFVERGLLDLGKPVQSYLPEFRGQDKNMVLVEDLLAHSGGLLWWTELYERFEGRTPEEAKRGYIDAICELPLDYPPRSKTVYSDLGILLLGEILERITGKPLDALARDEIFAPLGMDEAMYLPPPSLLTRIAPTEVDPWRGRLVHGEVHDENAFGLGGVAPHAGLFSTARGLAPFAQMMLNGGAYNGRRLLNARTIARFTSRANLVEGSSRALGWDTPSEPSSAGLYFSSASFGHTGFTGTSLWIDPERELFAILLTNRVHPTRENRKIFDLRPAFHDAVMTAIVDVNIKRRE